MKNPIVLKTFVTDNTVMLSVVANTINTSTLATYYRGDFTSTHAHRLISENTLTKEACNYPDIMVFEVPIKVLVSLVVNYPNKYLEVTRYEDTHGRYQSALLFLDHTN